MKFISDFKFLILIGLISLLTVSIWFRHGYQLGTAEGGLPFNNLERHAEIFKWAWGDGAMGNSTSFLVASYPTYFVLSQFEKIGVPGFLTEAIVFWSVLTSAGIGIFLIARKIVGISPGFALLAVFFYWLSPFVLVNVWNRFLYNHIFFLALLPLSFFTFWLGIEKKRFSYALLTVLVTFLFSYSLTALALTSLLFAVFSSVSIYWLILEKALNRSFIILYCLLFILFFGLVHAWWLSQLLFIGSSANFNESVSSFFSSEGNIGGLTEISRKLGSFIDLTRGIHFNFFYDNSSIWSASFVSSLALILNSTILFIIFLGIVFSRRNKVMLFFSLLLLLSFFFSKGNNPPFGELYTYLFVKMPFLQIFRNPVEKIGLISVFASSILAAYSLDTIYQRYLSKFTARFNGRNYLVIFSILCIGLFWGWPFFSGIALSIYKNEQGDLVWYHSLVPTYYKSANQAIKQNPNLFRFLALPLKDEGITYKWPVGYSGIDIYSTLFSKQNIALNTTIPFYNQIINQVVIHQHNSNLINFLPYLAVDHILLRRDIDYKARSYPDPAYSERLLNKLASDNYLKKEADFGELTLYSVSDSLNWGKFYTTNQIIFSNSFDFTKSVDTPFEVKKVYINPLLFNNLDLKPVEILIFPEKVNHYDWLQSFQSFQENDMYSKLLFVKHSPDDIIYPLVRSKELLTSLLYADYPKWVLFNTDLLGKRAVEICRYDPDLKKTSKEDQLIKNYQKEFENLNEHIYRISTENRHLKNEIFQSVITQALLLDRCQKIKIDYFYNFFVQFGIISPLSPKFTYESLTDILYKIPVAGDYSKHTMVEENSITEQTKLDQGDYRLQFSDNDIYSKKIIKNLSGIAVSYQWVDKDLIEIDDYNSEYSILIEYEINNGDYVEFFIRQDNDPQTSPIFLMKMPAKSGQQQFSFTPSIGSKSIQIGITGDQKSFCSVNCSGKTNNLNLYIKKLQIVKKTLNLPYFSQTNNKPFHQSDIKWKKISPVEYELSVNKSSSDKEILVFSELFAQGWKLESRDLQHILVNGYANGWILDKPEKFTTKVYYQPQYKLNLGYKISISVIIVTLILIMVVRKYEID